jgi:hypothetical protein
MEQTDRIESVVETRTVSNGAGRELQRAEWGVVVSLIISAATALFSAGVLYGQLQAQDARLTKVETASVVQQAAIAQQAVTVARIDANVTILVDNAKERGVQR